MCPRTGTGSQDTHVQGLLHSDVLLPYTPHLQSAVKDQSN